MTVQGIPATVTECMMSSGFWPRLEPEMVRVVPPSSRPVRGSICGCQGKFFNQSDLLDFFLFLLLQILKNGKAAYRVDDGGGASLLHRFAAGVGVQAAGVVSAAAPHAAVLGFGRVASAAVGAAHGAVVQGHCGRPRVQVNGRATLA